jgi:hypothetical protein
VAKERRRVTHATLLVIASATGKWTPNSSNNQPDSAVRIAPSRSWRMAQASARIVLRQNPPGICVDPVHRR